MSTPFHDDLLSRKEFSDRLERFLLTEHQFADGALVVSLQAPFGSGKTYFLENWKNSLQHRRTEKQPDTENKTLPGAIMLNAWESDYCGDPLLALISAIIKNLETDTAEEEKLNIQTIKEALKDMGSFGLGLLNSFLILNTGIDTLAAKEYAEGAKEKRAQQEHPEINLLETFENKQRALNKIKEQLKTLFGGNEVRAIIMIDELDRCRPDYAISYLETIKHIFDLHGLVFVLAVDHAQLRSAAKALFGADMNFDEYFRKFAQRRITLPEIKGEETIRKIVSRYFEKYIKNENRFSKLSNDESKNITDMVSVSNLNFRQIQEIFRIVGHALSRKEENRGILWCWSASTILMSVLSVINPTLFSKFGKNELTLHDACDVLQKLIKDLHPRAQKWWMTIFILGYSIPKNENEERSSFDELKHYGKLVEAEKFDGQWRETLAQFIRGWDIYDNTKLPFPEIYTYIEELKIMGEYYS
jgi:hypothetical protein